ncbi:MAG: arylamine N-acetyltransferase [Taibaiella sp.]|nr:arylamine N-acetyltransferase [Taibaiella sp.]
MDFKTYLKRIQYDGPLQEDFQTLTDLYHKHLFAVPFEDLDIYYGIPVSLDKRDIYNKVVNNNRGGYCYELNTLFCELLKYCNFHAWTISAQLVNGNKISPQNDHMAIVVALKDQLWLLDAGYGDFAIRPLCISSALVQNDTRCNYRISEVTIAGINYYGVDKWNKGLNAFKTEYLFTLEPAEVSAFIERHYYQQSASESHFVRNLVCTLPTHNGRVSIINNKLIITQDDIKRGMLLKEDIRILSLKQYFNISFSIPVEAV